MFARTVLCVPRLFRPQRVFQRCQSRQVALTGIQPTGKPHLGNYLGVIRPCMDLQQSGQLSQLLLLVADMHSLTSSTVSHLTESILDLCAILIACLFSTNPTSSEQQCQTSLFLQSAVRGHTELAWILASNCSLPRLAHLPQWKDKSGLTSADSILANNSSSNPIESDHPSSESDAAMIGPSVGLFTYPILQAADILLYGANMVPVGVDQTAHIELARHLVRTTTNRWPSLQSLLQIPSSLVLGVPKINSLRNPTKKMSKSDSSEAGIIYVTDTADVIRSKVKRAETDSIRSMSYDAQNRPGVSNLLRILSALQRRPMEDLLEQASQWNKETLKSHVVDALVEELAPIQSRVTELKTTPEGQQVMLQHLQHGSNLANRIAGERLEAIYSAIGCGIPHFLNNDCQKEPPSDTLEQCN